MKKKISLLLTVLCYTSSQLIIGMEAAQEKYKSYEMSYLMSSISRDLKAYKDVFSGEQQNPEFKKNSFSTFLAELVKDSSQDSQSQLTGSQRMFLASRVHVPSKLIYDGLVHNDHLSVRGRVSYSDDGNLIEMPCLWNDNNAIKYVVDHPGNTRVVSCSEKDHDHTYTWNAATGKPVYANWRNPLSELFHPSVPENLYKLSAYVSFSSKDSNDGMLSARINYDNVITVVDVATDQVIAAFKSENEVDKKHQILDFVWSPDALQLVSVTQYSVTRFNLQKILMLRSMITHPNPQQKELLVKFANQKSLQPSECNKLADMGYNVRPRASQVEVYALYTVIKQRLEKIQSKPSSKPKRKPPHRKRKNKNKQEA